MAFQFTEFGRLIATDPKRAHAQLVSLFGCDEEGPVRLSDVAAELGSNKTQVSRWIKKLVDLGYPDPRGGVRAGRGKDRAKRGKSARGRVG